MDVRQVGSDGAAKNLVNTFVQAWYDIVQTVNPVEIIEFP
jgi:hypothetical protein